MSGLSLHSTDPSAVTNFTIDKITVTAAPLTWALPQHPNGPISHSEVYYKELGTGANAANCNGPTDPTFVLDVEDLYENVTAPLTTSSVLGLRPYKCYGFQVRAVVEFRNTLLFGDIAEELRNITFSTSKNALIIHIIILVGVQVQALSLSVLSLPL